MAPNIIIAPTFRAVSSHLASRASTLAASFTNRSLFTCAFFLATAAASFRRALSRSQSALCSSVNHTGISPVELVLLLGGFCTGLVPEEDVREGMEDVAKGIIVIVPEMLCEEIVRSWDDLGQENIRALV